MFEAEASSQRGSQLDDDANKLQDAFTARLPTFSLPPNLNDKLASNKQKQGSVGTPAAAAAASRPRLSDLRSSRPRLSNLRSTWLSQQSFEEDAFADDKIIDIRLPPLVPGARLKSTRLVFRGISTLAIVATLLCLASTAYLALQPSASLPLFSVCLGGWVLLSVWSMLDSDRFVHSSLAYLKYCAVVMLVVTGWSHNETALPFSVSCLLFNVAERLSTAYQQLQAEILEQQTQQQTLAQQAIDSALDEYADRRTLFLSTVSQEIRDAALMVMATLEQFSPSSILSNTHELLSACSIAVPIASISAMNTTIKQACHISSHLNLVARMLRQSLVEEQDKVKSYVSEEFDMGELIQNVGDALAGMSAKLGVHFVVYHTDNGLYYPNVVGDQDAVKHALINLLRNMLEGCTPGACIELGLYIAPIPASPKVKVTFDIVQIASPAIPAGLSGALLPNANFTARLLDYIGGTMELQDQGKNKTRVEVSLELYRGSNSDQQRLLLIEKPSQILEKQLSSIRFSNEPTLDDLSMFISKLKGVKIVLHAPERSIFAKHLTSCLTSWNTDISHLPVLMAFNGDEEGPLQQQQQSDTAAGSDSEASSVGSQQQQQQQPLKTPMDGIQASSLSPASTRSLGSDTSKKVPSPAIEEDHLHSIPPTFILIDDDIMTLEKKLRELRDKFNVVPTAAPPPPRRHRRSKSRQGGAGGTTAENLSAYGTIAIVFFTSLGNYKRVRDTIHWFSSLSQTPNLPPRVIVVPKPAGPRRFLTALHTAWNNAIVEPQFMPIATSPLSPFVTSNAGLHPSHRHHFSPADSGSNSTTGTNNAMTPGTAVAAAAGVQSSLMTPHDMSRFSPGRRTTAAATRGLHSPSNLQMESEKGNYFFDPSRPSGPHVSAKVNTSPLLSAVPGNGIASPVAMATSGVPLPTPGSNSSVNGGGGGNDSVSSHSSTASNATPAEIKRRLRSHSSTFMAPTGRRTLVDLSVSPTLPPHGIAGNTAASPVTEATEQEEQEAVASAAAAVSPKVNMASPSNLVENTQDAIDQDSARVSAQRQTLPSESNLDNNTSVRDPFKATESPPSPSSSPGLPNPSSIAPTADEVVSVATPAATTTTPQSTTTTSSNKSKSSFSLKINNRKRKEKVNSSGKQSPPITVLIVEDNMINQAILSTWMKKHSIKFSVASDGKEAVEKWKGGGFHLILMDIQLPVMDGIAATKMIRSIEKERKIGVLPSNSLSLVAADGGSDQSMTNSTIVEEAPAKKEDHEEEEQENVISKKESSTTNNQATLFQSPVIIVALTASSLESDRQAALAAGCNDFLTKPVSLEWLEKKIMEWGCMQALIDFEGWRKWKRSADGSKPSATARAEAVSATAAITATQAPAMTKEASEALAHEKQMLALRTQEMLKDDSKAIVLVGIHKRRMSTLAGSSLDDRSMYIAGRADSNSSSSTLSLQQQLPASGSPTRASFHHRLRKRASDPDLYTHELSIPKQVEARAQRRLLELQQWQEDDSTSSCSE
ncbi:hypothetical protein [Parasitella parasitica]|uniref:Response regulatory domain-containing protein n=1 Tax=Parasitella parasitica TaxID=35722 RepID=A0A0B7N2A8_9FUNG|nr:hypothetical protein [Parasitella parasitica]